MKDQINTILKKIGLKAEEIKLEQVTVDNGAATLEAESFEAGQPVFIVNEDERIPLPVGEYPLDNEMILVVVEEGIISEMKEATVEEVVEEEPMQEVEASTEEPNKATPKSIIKSIVEEVKFSAEEMEAKELEIVELKKQIEDLTKVEEVVELAEEAKPISFNPEKEVKTENFKYANNKPKSILDTIYSKIN
jgi:hypothetical protein